MITEENSLTYTPNSNSDSDSSVSSDGDNDDGEILQLNTESREQTVVTEEYDSSSEADTVEPTPNLSTDNEERSKVFVPRENVNFFRMKGKVCVCLLPNQFLYVSGVFTLQVVKGNVVYNNLQYTPSMVERLTFWHPLCNAVPSIQGRESIEWSKPIEALQEFKVNLDMYACILYVLPGPVEGLMDAYRLYPDVRYFWKPRPENEDGNESETDSQFSMETFTILQGIDVQFSALEVPSSWENCIERLSMISKNAVYDTRVMVLGAKNTGKSSFLRLFIERLLFDSHNGHHYNDKNDGADHSSNNGDNGTDSLLYFDLDPGQPEYSLPESLSLTEITNKGQFRAVGNCLGQHNFSVQKQFYLGSANPEDNFNLYLEQIDDLIEFFEAELFYGVSVVNLPGWVKGFGMRLINHVIQRYKPTCIVVIDSPSTATSFNQELHIPQQFSNPLQRDYSPTIIHLSAFNSTLASRRPQPRYQSSQIRTLRKLLLFHRLPDLDDKSGKYRYDFRPLVNNSPLQIGLNVRGGIEAIKFDEEFKVLHKGDIKYALEGTVVAITLLRRDSHAVMHTDLNRGDLYPLVHKDIRNKDLTFLTLGMVHSIDEDKKVLNIYLPQRHVEMLRRLHTWSRDTSNSSMEDTPEALWCIIRSKSDTLFCEICPPDGVQYGWNIVQMPYVSVTGRKKHEHVWKVRKNILRRGYVNK